MTLQGLVNWFLPRDDRFFVMLEQHADVLSEAATVMAGFFEKRTDPATALAEIRRIEQRGDDLTHAMTIALDETFVTPIDREDLHSLATTLDSVIDCLYRGLAAFVTHEVCQVSPAMRELGLLCSEAAMVLKDAVPYIRGQRLEKLAPARQRIVEQEKRGDAIYRAELAALFKDPEVDAKELLRQKAVLDALEAALNSCQDAADVLENVAVKHA